MLKTLWPHARPYSKWICLGVLCSAAEAVFELLIPLVMSDIVDIGIANGDQDFILRKGIQMVIMAMVSLCFGLGRGGPALPSQAWLRRQSADGGV